MLYSYNAQYPQSKPFRIRLPDGTTRTNESVTDEVLLEAGYAPISDPPDTTLDQVLEWNSVNLSWIIRDKSLEEIELEKQNRLFYISENRDAELNQLTCQWDNYTWDARETDSTRIANVLTMIEQASNQGIPTPTTIDWRTFDDQTRSLTVAQLTQLGASMFQAQQVIWYKQAMLKDQILAATTVSEIKSITW